VDPPREPGPHDTKVALFFEPEYVLVEPKDSERGSDEEEEDLRFTVYSSPVHMHNVNISADDALEFPDLPYRRHDHTSSLLDLGELKVGKDGFLGALK